ncbi:MAG: PSD1 and planctomycete cytochrome C domain-containing protein [Acidobacteriota bacterium]
MLSQLFRLFGLLLLLCVRANGQTPSSGAASPDEFEFFERRIRPLLAQHCHSCHGDQVQTAGLNLASSTGFFKGGDSGPVIIKGEPENSRLVEAVSYHSRIKMPPSGRLKDSEIADLVAWIKMGAPWPGSITEWTAAPPEARTFSKEQKEFWSFQPVKDPQPPPVISRSWVRTPIDQFILSELEKQKLAPAPEADKLALLRRATFDLTGLPPSPAEIDEFLKDNTPQAFTRVVDRLLSSPRYGERWGRHWLDVVRYADSAGADEDIKYPYAWRYRDYVIDAFNRDLSYSEFIRQQLAGDLLPAEKPGQLNVTGIVATGFLQVGPKLLAEQDKPKMVYDMVDEQLDVTTRAFLGLTVSCARCHDHKFDPIPTRDYYSLASIFASTRSLEKVDSLVSQLLFVPLAPEETVRRYREHQARLNSKEREIQNIIDDQAFGYSARLRPKLAEYMLATWRFLNHGSEPEPPAVEPFAAAQGLDVAVLKRWIDYLKPSSEVRPHLQGWYDASRLALAQTEGTTGLPVPSPELVAEAQALQEKTEAEARRWEEAIATWRTKVQESEATGKDAPKKPVFDASRNRFFAEIAFDKGPLALPEQDPEAWFSAQAKERLASLRAELGQLKESSPPEPPMACAVQEGEPIQQRVFIRGNVANPGEEVPKQFLTVIAGENQTPVTQGSGRLELANWLTRPEHPLTARVMVNRIWQWHFGEGLVRTPSNFGTLGEPPSHPELLDYLASRFVESGWSVKAMHRLIMLSSAYRISSEGSQRAAESDPTNRLLSHMNRRRLDVEEIRDGLLSITGDLDLSMGGSLQSGFGTDGENSDERLSFDPDSSTRRTVYLSLRRSNLPALLNLFDFGDATTSSEGRSRTNVASQALYLMNSDFIRERSAKLARTLLSQPGNSDASRIEAGYLRILGREPTREELKEAVSYLQEYREKANRTATREAALDAGNPTAWQSLCHVLMASNEFIFVD